MTSTTPTTDLTTDDLEALSSDLATLDVERFATDFYDTLFEIAPGVRDLFPDDLTAQRRKLMVELATLVRMATSIASDSDGTAAHIARLGERHRGYGAAPAHYEVVGSVLLTTLARHVPGWNESSHRRWEELYTYVATNMQRGSAGPTAE